MEARHFLASFLIGGCKLLLGYPKTFIVLKGLLVVFLLQIVGMLLVVFVKKKGVENLDKLANP